MIRGILRSLVLLICAPAISLAQDLSGSWILNGNFIPVPDIALTITSSGGVYNATVSQAVLVQDIGCSLDPSITYLIFTPLGGNVFAMQKYAPFPFLCFLSDEGSENVTIDMAPDTNSFVGCRVSNPNDCSQFTRQGVVVTPPDDSLSKKYIPGYPTVTVKGKLVTVVCPTHDDVSKYEAKIQRRKKPATSKTSKNPSMKFPGSPKGDYIARCRYQFKPNGSKKTLNTLFGAVTAFQVTK